MLQAKCVNIVLKTLPNQLSLWNRKATILQINNVKSSISKRPPNELLVLSVSQLAGQHLSSKGKLLCNAVLWPCTWVFPGVAGTWWHPIFAVLTVLQQMRWFVSGSSTSVQSLVRKAGTLLEYPSITRELGESCIVFQCPSYTNPIALGVPASLHARASDREWTTKFYPRPVESRLPGSHISSAACTLKNSAQCNGITSPREQYTEWKCTAADLTELWINTQRHAKGTRATHLMLRG